MLSQLSWSLAAALIVSAAPHEQSPPSGLKIPLTRRSGPRIFASEDEVGVWAKHQADSLRGKYGVASSGSSSSKRAQGFNLLTNQNRDTSYFGNVAIGTPPVSYNVILDTGSSDLWIAAANCYLNCGDVPKYDSSKSSTFRNSSTPFSITYGSGAARGELVQDTVQIAGFSVPSQTFAAVDRASTGLLESPVSGLLGLAFQSIASSRAKPVWQALADGGSLTTPLMSFVLTRYLNVTTSAKEAPGGIFTLGYLDNTLYDGDVEYTSLTSQTYWLIQMTSITVNGKSALNRTSTAAIDTGTTLVGGPASQIAAIYAQIPGSTIGTGNYEGYYLFPCATDVTVQLTFGNGRPWSISPDDFILQQVSQSTCLGAFFTIDISGSGAPDWIVGDTFLKNVMSVYRYNPPSVGFAQLKSDATRAFASVPTPTIGSNPITLSNAALPSGSSLLASSTLSLGAIIAGVCIVGSFA